ncbi:MAG: Slp family lipoprotein [Candidatus Thiodiazotropha sp.]
MRLPFTLSASLILLVLTGCSSAPKVTENAVRGLTPTQAAATEIGVRSRPLQWGGVIVETRNLAETTELQILAYPLKSNGQPDLSASPTGRFIAQRAGYLERVDYRKGRQVTATGKLTQRRKGLVGEADYTFPVLLADELVLWPEQSTRQVKPRVNFGIGVGSGGRSWGGVGIGVGF